MAVTTIDATTAGGEAQRRARAAGNSSMPTATSVAARGRSGREARARQVHQRRALHRTMSVVEYVGAPLAKEVKK